MYYTDGDGECLYSQYSGGRSRGISMTLMPAWSTVQILGHLGQLQIKSLSQK